MALFLSVQGLSKSFGQVKAVDNVSFTAEKGQLVAILGPSGCGKTTLLRLIAGFESPDAGSVFVDGRRIDHLSPEKRRIGMLFQNYALFPHMTVAENIAYGLRFQRPTAKPVREVVSTLLEMVGLSGYEDRRPEQLSAGQQQRVAIARAIAPQPRLLLLDEPLSALDVALRDHLRLNIRRIQRELGLTTLYVTHDQEEALSIADHIVVMRSGAIEQEGSPVTLYEEPKTAFVAGFFGRTALIPTRLLPPASYKNGAQNQNSVAVLRAERVDPAGPGIPLHGTLTEVEYFGHFLRLQVEGTFGTVWGTAPGTAFSKWRTQIGSEVTLYFDPSITPIVPEEAEQPK